MTYPPQQPGPPYGQDPYGQQPQPYGQQPPQPQQGWGQTQQFGQPDPYGAPDPYNAPDPYAQQQYPGYGVEPPKKNTGKIVAVVAIAVLLLGGAGTAVYFLTKGDDKGNGGPSSGLGVETSSSTAKPTRTSKTTTSPTSESDEPATTSATAKPTTTKPSTVGGGGTDMRAVGVKYVDAVNEKDEAAATGLTCDGTEPGTLYSSVVPAGGTAEVVGQPETISDENGVVNTKVTITGTDPIDFPILMQKKEKGWCVSF